MSRQDEFASGHGKTETPKPQFFSEWLALPDEEKQRQGDEARAKERAAGGNPNLSSAQLSSAAPSAPEVEGARFRDQWGDPDPKRDTRFSYMKDSRVSYTNSQGQCEDCSKEMPEPWVLLHPKEGSEDEYEEDLESGLRCENCANRIGEYSSHPYSPPQPVKKKKTRKRR